MATAVPQDAGTSFEDAKSRNHNIILDVLIDGLKNPQSPLFQLNGLPHILRQIWSLVEDEWQKCIKTFTSPPSIMPNWRDYDEITQDQENAYLCFTAIQFPKYKGININMMPFVMSKPFKNTKLPKHLEPYYNIIFMCYKKLDEAEMGKIGYLTVHESVVDADSSQRRPGVHVEKGRRVCINVNDGTIASPYTLGGSANVYAPPLEWSWGRGWTTKKCRGGIFMATNLSESSKIWNCKIMDHPVDNDEVIGNLGDISHLEHLLPNGDVLESNMLYWMTDRTPHQSLPVKENVKRQFFRLVTSDVTFWYEEHSTPNPKGVVPDPNITMIIKGSKFGQCRVASDSIKEMKKKKNDCHVS